MWAATESPDRSPGILSRGDGSELVRLPALADNYVWLVPDRTRGEALVVDPAGAAPVLDFLRQEGLRLTCILNTHHHDDHTGGNLDLKRETGCRIIGPAADSARIPGIDAGYGNGEYISCAHGPVQVLDTPGHTRGHVSYWFPEKGLLFCGDTLFSMGCGRLFEGTAGTMWASLRLLRALPGDALVCCAHEYTLANTGFALAIEPDNSRVLEMAGRVRKLRGAGLATVPSLLGDEKRANPFLRADEPPLAAALGMEGASPDRVFASLRARKDRYRH